MNYCIIEKIERRNNYDIPSLMIIFLKPYFRKRLEFLQMRVSSCFYFIPKCDIILIIFSTRFL